MNKKIATLFYWVLGILVPIFLAKLDLIQDCSIPSSDIYFIVLIILTCIVEKYAIKYKLKEKGFELILFYIVILLYWFNVISLNISCPSDKAIQGEASFSIASYIRASEAYYTENGAIAKSSKDLGQYIPVTGCKENKINSCKITYPLEHQFDYTTRNSTTWYLPSGIYKITMQAKGKENIFIAEQAGRYPKKL